MPRSSESNAALRERQGGRIREAARRVFARRGYAGARTAEIAAVAGVSVGLLHHYFESKERLFVAVIDATMEAADQLPRQALAMPGSAWERLRFLISTMVAGARAMPEHFLLLQALSSEAAPEAARQLVDEKGADGLALMAELVRQGQVEGSVVGGDPRVLMLHVLSAIEGAAARLFFQSAPAGFPDATLILGLLQAHRGVA